jgi:hypothetical protein
MVPEENGRRTPVPLSAPCRLFMHVPDIEVIHGEVRMHRASTRAWADFGITNQSNKSV